MAGTHQTVKPGSFLDLILQQQIYVMTNDFVSINNTAGDITPVMTLPENCWCVFNIYAILFMEVAQIQGNGGLALTANAITNGWYTGKLNRSSDSQDVSDSNSTGWNGYNFDDTTFGFAIPPTQDSGGKNRYHVQYTGRFKTGTSPTLKFSYTSAVLDVDDLLVEHFAFQYARATNPYTLS